MHGSNRRFDIDSGDLVVGMAIQTTFTRYTVRDMI
jgi:hypothetical protein